MLKAFSQSVLTTLMAPNLVSVLAVIRAIRVAGSTDLPCKGRQAREGQIAGHDGCATFNNSSHGVSFQPGALVGRDIGSFDFLRNRWRCCDYFERAYWCSRTFENARTCGVMSGSDTSSDFGR